MAERKGGVTHSMILWVAGTLITIVVFVGIIWPWLLGVWYGSCWTDARSDVRGLGSEIEGAIRSPGAAVDYKLTMGDCIAGVVFVNGREDPNFSSFVSKECEGYEGYKSYMLLIPQEYPLTLSTKEVPDNLKDSFESLKDSFSVWAAIKLWIKDQLGRVPEVYCYELEHDFTMDSIKSVPTAFYGNWLKKDNWNPGTEPYCVKVTGRSATSGYNYEVKQIRCPNSDGGSFGGGGATGDF